MAIKVKIQGVDKLKKVAENFNNTTEAVRRLTFDAAGDFAVEAHSFITEKYLSGPRPEKLGVITGRLRSSIKFKVEQSDNVISIRFGSDVPYAAIHEFGGDAGRGGKVHIRKRPFLTPGIEDALPDFQKSLQDILEKVAKGVVPPSG